MKNYKVTNRGKIFLITYFSAMIAGYFFATIMLYFLVALLLALLGVEITTYLLNSRNNESTKGKLLLKKESDIKVKAVNLEEAINLANEEYDERKKAIEIVDEDEDEAIEASINKANVEPTLEERENDYENVVDDLESIKEDIHAMEKDLEAIGNKADNFQKEAIESYFVEKKKNISKDLDNASAQASEIIEEKSLIDTFFEWLKEFFDFKRYKKGNLVLHNHFGIGKIIGTEETLEVSFINNEIEEIIEFEYDKNNKIPELNLFKTPKGEDERQYYYNYKRDISEELSSTIEKIGLNLPDIKCQWNISLKSGSAFEVYDFIAISDQVHVFSKSKEGVINLQLLEDLLKDIEIKIKKHEISDYSSINSILLKAKIKGIMSLDLMNTISQRIGKGNIKDFNERLLYADEIENLDS